GVRHPRRRGGDLPLRRDSRHGHAAGPHPRGHADPAAAPAPAQRHPVAGVRRHQGALPEPPHRCRAEARGGRLMAVQDAPRSTELSGIATAQVRPAAGKPARRLPVQKDWPGVAIIATQVLILAALIGGWEMAARAGWLDAFFWSQPSAIWKTLVIYFTEGDAWTDIGFTFRSTILGFIIGTTAGSLLGLSFWWSRNYAAV